MKSGPDQIVACPYCQGFAKYSTVLSGNRNGVRIWTDGKQVASSLPRPPAVVKCRHCARPYWLTDAKEIGKLPQQGASPKIDPAWKEAEYVVEAPEGDYYLALQAKLAQDRGLEKVLRTLVWWRGNDADRELAPDQEGIATAYPEQYGENLTALAEMFNTKRPNERIMKAEAMRELGQFEEGVKILDGIQERDFDAVVRRIRELCERADAVVREIDAVS